MHSIKDGGDYEYGCSSVKEKRNQLFNQLFKSFIPKQVMVMIEKHIA